MQTTYTLDGQTTVFQFNWPYLDRSHIMVTVDLAARPFKFINDHTISVRSIFGEALPAGGVLKITRVTPDLDAFAEFKDAANLTSQDLNRARLQCLFLIQERSGGLGGSVGSAVQLLTNEIETISGALDGMDHAMGVLTAGLQTLEELGTTIKRVDNEAEALRDLINKTLEDNAADMLAMAQRVDSVVAAQNNLSASVNTSINTFVTATTAQASRVDNLEAKVDAIDLSGENGDEKAMEALSASLITAAVASVKNNVSQVKRIETLEVKVGDDLQAIIQTEQETRASKDAALAKQITDLQASINGDLASLQEEMSVSADAQRNLNAQWVMKAQVTRADGKPVFAAIGLAATANNDISKSEIVLQANRFVFADAANINGPLKPVLVSGMVDGSPTLIVPANNMGDKAYPGRLFVDGAIGTRELNAEAVTADKIKAGAVTIEKLDVNLGVNLLPESSFVNGLQGWSTGGNIPSAIFQVNLAGDGYRAGNLNYACIRVPDLYGSGNPISAFNNVLVSARVPVTAGERYEFSAYIGAHRCRVLFQMFFLDMNGNAIPNGGIGGSEENNGEAGGGQTLAWYKRIGNFMTAPAGAVSVIVQMVKGPTTSGSDSYAMMIAPMLAVARPNQTRFSPWGPSGLGTAITPAGISTPSLSALSANIGSLVSYWPDGGRVERDGNGTRVYDQNGVLRVRMGRW